MALIKCSECGNEISDKAKACIHCGCPIEEIDEMNEDVMDVETFILIALKNKEPKISIYHDVVFNYGLSLQEAKKLVDELS